MFALMFIYPGASSSVCIAAYYHIFATSYVNWNDTALYVWSVAPFTNMD